MNAKDMAMAARFLRMFADSYSVQTKGYGELICLIARIEHGLSLITFEIKKESA